MAATREKRANRRQLLQTIQAPAQAQLMHEQQQQAPPLMLRRQQWMRVASAAADHCPSHRSHALQVKHHWACIHVLPPASVFKLTQQSCKLRAHLDLVSILAIRRRHESVTRLFTASLAATTDSCSSSNLSVLLHPLCSGLFPVGVKQSLSFTVSLCQPVTHAKGLKHFACQRR